MKPEERKVLLPRWDKKRWRIYTANHAMLNYPGLYSNDEWKYLVEHAIIGNEKLKTNQCFEAWQNNIVIWFIYVINHWLHTHHKLIYSVQTVDTYKNVSMPKLQL